jgi:methionyl-tRNA formyltransferase
MRVVLLTTKTLHHLYFSTMLCDTGYLIGVALETPGREPTFPTFHPFEALRDEYEKKYFFHNTPPRFEDLTEIHLTDSVNDPETLDWMNRMRPDLTVVFGTRRLSPKTIEIANLDCLNLHGGNPELYRGLDSHYWTIYHSDFENLVTTLHHVDIEYDTGPLVSFKALSLFPNMEIHQLRAVNTEACVELVLNEARKIDDGRSVSSVPQKEKGRYYSAMPAVLKEECMTTFKTLTKSIFNDQDWLK